MRLLIAVIKNLTRNKLRTVLTALAVIVLVYIHTTITTVVGFLESFTTEKSKDVKLVISERYRPFSNFDRRHLDDMLSPRTYLGQELRQIPGFDPEKHTVWHFVGFTLDPNLKDPDKAFFVLATYPDKIRTMTDNLKPEDFEEVWAEALKHPPNLTAPSSGLVLGGTLAKKLGKKVGDVFLVYSTSHFDRTALRRPIKLEFEVIGVLTENSAWNDAAFMDVAYLDTELHKQKNEYDGKVTWAWLQVNDLKSAEEVSLVIERHIRDLRCETSATANSRFMAPLQGMLWGMKWILMPAILIVMAIILANTFSLTVRERQTEIAVLKVLGFRSRHILTLVLGEAALVGGLAGLIGATLTFVLVNGQGGIHLTMMPVLRILPDVFVWGPLLGLVTGLVGGIIPALLACRVNVSNAFASTA